ncbi:uncharacterized protein LOC131029257 isoform X3 [Cryptomeria japonica]|uniref:uncharacterized protein LOC131029257 isoform X3 n=1 Tax=Cryptomeria japonica TaxID=3369 RepID=UPI0025ABE8AB|nr:uncharacterized protein LOC131029257 isoform X3 [Cryptomeria japonica]
MANIWEKMAIWLRKLPVFSPGHQSLSPEDSFKCFHLLQQIQAIIQDLVHTMMINREARRVQENQPSIQDLIRRISMKNEKQKIARRFSIDVCIE